MRNIIKEKKVWVLLALIFGARLLTFVFFYSHITIFPDSSGYLDLANRLMGLDLLDYSGARSPGYPLLITLAFGNQVLLVFYQFLLGTISVLLWFLSLQNFNFGPKISFYTALFIGLCLNMIFFETAVLVESLVLFLVSVVVFQISKAYLEEAHWKIDLWMSLILGFLVLVKPFYAFLPFLFFALFLLKNWSWKSIYSTKLILFIFPLLAYFGWSTINQINTGHFVSTTFLGLNQAQNCVRFAEKSPKEYEWIAKPYVEARERVKAKNGDIAMSIWDAYNSGAYEKYGLSFPDLSAEMGKFARRTIRENPLKYAHQVIFYSWANFWKPGIMWNYDQFNFPYANKFFLLIWKVEFYVLILFRALFLLSVPATFLRAIQKKKIDFAFTLTSIVISASILQGLVTYGSNSRFSFPFEFMMIFVVLLSLSNLAPIKYQFTGLKNNTQNPDG